MTRVYGIKNCDTVKKALKWLAENDFEATLHDYRKDGLDPVWLAEMAQKLGWETLVNKKSATWRSLDESIKANLNAETVLTVLADNPTLIKRPIVNHGEVVLIGFNAEEYAAQLK